MERKTFKSLLLLIGFAALLIAVVVKLDQVLIGFSKGVRVIQPLILGGSIAFVLNRPYKWLQPIIQKGTFVTVPDKYLKHLSLGTIYLMFIGFMIGVVGFVIPQVIQSVQILYENLGNYIGNFNELITAITEYFKVQQIDLTDFESTLSDVPNMVSKGVTGLMPGIFNFTSNLVSSILNIIIGFILSIYILADKDHLKKQFKSLVHVYMTEKYRAPLLRVLRLTHETFSHFVIGQLTEALILAVLCFIGMKIFGFEYALLISVLMGLTSIIPVVGPLVGLIPSLFILVISSPMQAFWFLIFILILQQIEGSLIYPRVVGSQIGLPGLWVLSTITVGGGLFGILGMLLGIPLVSVIYKLIKQDVTIRKGALNE